MADRMAGRRSVLDELALPAREGLVVVEDAGTATRFIYRGAPELLGAAFGVALPQEPMRAALQDGRAALWLGPDEWLLLAPEREAVVLTSSILEAISGKAAALVDIGHRQVDLIVSGPRVEVLLNAGCPLDLDIAAFPVGVCTRTLLAKAEILLWRTAADSFRVEVARSFAPYVVALLAEAMHGID